MPVHPTPISCELHECSTRAILDPDGQPPKGWLIVEAIEVRSFDPPPPPVIPIPEGVDEGVKRALEAENESMRQMAEAEEPERVVFRGRAVYCPKHASYLATRLQFPDRDLWEEVLE